MPRREAAGAALNLLSVTACGMVGQQAGDVGMVIF
jgi:hypothetical protein